MATKFHRIYKLESFGPEKWWQLRGFFFTVDDQQMWFKADPTVDRAVEWLKVFRRRLGLKFRLINTGLPPKRAKLNFNTYPGSIVRRLHIEFTTEEQAYQYLNHCLRNGRWFSGQPCPELDDLQPAVIEQYVEQKQRPGETVEELNERADRERVQRIKRIQNQ